MSLAIAANSTAYRLVDALTDKERGDPLVLWTKIKKQYGDEVGTSAVLKSAELQQLRIVGRDLSGYLRHVEVLRQQIKAAGEEVSETSLKCTLLVALDACKGFEDICTSLRDSVVMKSRTMTYDQLKEAVLEYDRDSGNLQRLTIPKEDKKVAKRKAEEISDDAVKALVAQLRSENQELTNQLKHKHKNKNKSNKWKKDFTFNKNPQGPSPRNNVAPDDRQEPKANDYGKERIVRYYRNPPYDPKRKRTFVVRVNKATITGGQVLKFYGDSGAEAHVVSGEMFRQYEKNVREARTTSSTVQFGTGPPHKADAEVDMGRLDSALVVQRADKHTNLISLSRWDDTGGAVLIKGGKMYLFPPETTFETNADPELVGEREGGLYGFNADDVVMQLTSSTDVSPVKVCKVTTQNSRYSAESWHRALGHMVGYQKLVDMADHNSAHGLPQAMSTRFRKALRRGCPCLHCALGVFHQFPVGHELGEHHKFGVGEYWHLDIVGPFESSIGGSTYVVIANDEESSFTFDFYVKGKDVLTVIIPMLGKLIDMIISDGKTPRFFHFDADPVFRAEETKNFLISKHVLFGYSEPGEHRHSGSIEAIARVLEEGTRKMLASTEAEKRFWAYAFHQGTYIHNRVITSRFHNDPVRRHKTPIEIYKNIKPDLSKVVAWGAACVSRIPNPETLGKLDWRGRPGITLGNAPEYNDATFVYSIKTKKVVVSKDVRVDETRIGFTGKPTTWFASEVGHFQPDDRDVVVLEGEEGVEDAEAEMVDTIVDPVTTVPETPQPTPLEIAAQQPQVIATPQVPDGTASTNSEGVSKSKRRRNRRRKDGDGKRQRVGNSQEQGLPTQVDPVLQVSTPMEVQVTQDATPSAARPTGESSPRSNANPEKVKPNFGEYQRSYRTGPDRRRVTVTNTEPENAEIQRLIKKKINESMAKRLGETAAKMQLRSRAIARMNHRIHLANLISNMYDEDGESSEEDFPIARATFRAFAAKHVDDPEIPKTYAEAMSPEFCDKFGPAIETELRRIHESRVFGKPVRRKANRKPLGLKWIFDIKRRKDGTVERYKARLVAKGFTQVYGDSYFDTYALLQGMF